MKINFTFEIRKFISKTPLSAKALNKWYDEVWNNDWKSFSELKKTYNTCDFIGYDRYVFDIAGNNYRLIAMIHFNKRTLYIRKILTHDEYMELGKKGLLNTL
jgi:mRNA interferase HigB